MNGAKACFALMILEKVFILTRETCYICNFEEEIKLSVALVDGAVLGFKMS